MSPGPSASELAQFLEMHPFCPPQELTSPEAAPGLRSLQRKICPRYFHSQTEVETLAQESEPLLGQVLVCLWVTAHGAPWGVVALSLAHWGVLSGLHQNLYDVVQFSQVRLASGAGRRGGCSKALQTIAEAGLGPRHHSCEHCVQVIVGAVHI